MNKGVQPTDNIEKVDPQNSDIDPVSIGDKPGAFLPQTEADFNWLLGKINDTRARIDRIWVHAQTMVNQAEAEAKYYEWKYGAPLQAFVRRETAGKQRKSETLLNGVAGFRIKRAFVKIEDRDAALIWAKKNLPAAVYEAVALSMVAKSLSESGELVDFATYNPDEETFFIK